MRRTITIQRNCLLGNRIGQEIAADETGVPGLMTHRHVERPHLWTLTHEPSGFRVGPEYPTRKRAVAAAQTLSDLLDWTMSRTRVIRTFKSLPEAKRKALKLSGFGPRARR
ncbi:hypothetical protein LCGC14_0382480 [marine sediment metagenome]|uniref:Uncharacterized protein n=1 Tax=marine sediment metagenome TaxID=412755 RepID=A0A0F9T7T8_9ZZZZ